MDENLTLQTIPESGPIHRSAEDAFTAETLQPLVEAMTDLVRKLTEAIAPVIEELARAITAAVKNITKQNNAIWEELLHSVATRKEWHLYKHAKKRRTRKKYKRRLTLRVMAMMATEADGDDDEV